jgi:hypothetical protein
MTALYGVVGIGVPPPTLFPKPPPKVAATLSIRSEPGDFVGQGQTLRYSNLENALFQVAPGTFGIFVRAFAYDGPVWSVDLAGPGRVPPLAGDYEGATRNPFQPPDEPGLAVGGDGGGCNMLAGRFTVFEARYDPHGGVRSLRALFEQHCEAAAPALRGEVRVSVPQAPLPVALRLAPRSPVAGRSFGARLRLRGRSFGVQVRGVRCRAVVAGRRLRRTERRVGRRRDSCGWRLPGSSAGRTVRGFVSFEAAGRVVTRRFRERVR